MSRTEDYLDSLLNTVSPDKRKKSEEWPGDGGEKDYFNDFEKELNDSDMENFIRDFELEIDEDADEPLEEEYTDDSFFDNLEGVVKNVKNAIGRKKASEEVPVSEGLSSVQEEAAQPLTEPEVEESQEAYEINTLEDDSWTDPVSIPDEIEKSEKPEGTSMEEPDTEIFAQADSSDGEGEGEKELMDILSELPEDEELSNISALLKANEEKSQILEDSELEAENALETEEDTEEEPKGRKRRKKKKDKNDQGEGFFVKLSKIFFGEEEEDEISSEKSEQVKAPSMTEGIDLENISEENLQILKDLDDAEKASNDEEKVSKAQDKKKEKKDKKEQKAKEKKEKNEKKPKKEKIPKEKKEKKPREVDTSPPLPKGPVILTFVMGISIVILVIVSSNLLGYSVDVRTAKEAYGQKDYVEAYRILAGMKLKEGDTELYNQVVLLARVQEEYQSYGNLMYAKQYHMALDSLVCALGRYDINYEAASTLGLQAVYDEMAGQIQDQLSSQFNVSAEEAREFYSLEDRQEYTTRIYDIAMSLGME